MYEVQPSECKPLKSTSGVEKRIHTFFTTAGCTVLKNGWPDFLVVKGNRYLMMEAKNRHERVSTAQKEMHKTLRTLGFKVIVVRPEEDSLYEILSKLE